MLSKTAVRVLFVFGIVDMVLTCLAFALCTSLLACVPSERWLSFYTDTDFGYVANDAVDQEASFHGIFMYTLVTGLLLAVSRMAATHPFLLGVGRRTTPDKQKNMLLLPAIVVNGLALFYLVTVVAAMAINNSSTQDNVNFMVTAGFAIVYLVAYQVATTATLYKVKDK